MEKKKITFWQYMKLNTSLFVIFPLFIVGALVAWKEGVPAMAYCLLGIDAFVFIMTLTQIRKLNKK